MNEERAEVCIVNIMIMHLQNIFNLNRSTENRKQLEAK